MEGENPTTVDKAVVLVKLNNGKVHQVSIKHEELMYYLNEFIKDSDKGRLPLVETPIEGVDITKITT